VHLENGCLCLDWFCYIVTEFIPEIRDSMRYVAIPSGDSACDKIIGSHLRWLAGISLPCHMAVVDSKVFKSVVLELAILCIK